MYIHTYFHIFIHTYIHTNTRIYACRALPIVSDFLLYVYMHKYTYTYTFICTPVFKCIEIYIYTHIWPKRRASINASCHTYECTRASHAT